MNKLIAIVAAMLMLAGCPNGAGLNVQPLHAPVVVDSEDAVVKSFRVARNTIDETNAELTALNRVIKANVTARIWTPDQGQGYLNRSKAFGKDVDKAADALLLGNLNDATVRAAAVKALIMQLQLEVAKAARGG
jgi:hypothetical protein